ncbi:hypothetical protein, partial [Mesorhizobium sp.]|uniref:hypothetical protein n=1 Tax=Mesorhizobium sp. TaxID=1871066 RepID=UPI0025C3AF56
KFFVFCACHFRITPYNAPPLTRNNGTHAAGSTEKSENKRLTLKRESVICTPRAAAKSEAALLFNNLSDNLCGHSK